MVSFIFLLILINVLNIKCDKNTTVTPLTSNNDSTTIAVKQNLKPQKETTVFKNLVKTFVFITNKPSTVFHTNSYCSGIKTCLECVNSPIEYSCNWCHDYGCTDKPEILCPTTAEILYTLAENERCPRIEHESPILIPSGVRMNFNTKIHAPDPVLHDKELICQLKLTNRLTHLRGIIIGQTIFCYPVTLELEDDKPQEKGTLQVIWGGASPFSNEVKFVVYTCEDMGADCETCKAIPVEYGCGWCRKTESCVIGDKCSEDFMKWTLSRITCEELDKKMYFV